MRPFTSCLAVAMLVAPLARAHSQNASAGYIALASTPTAGVAPVAKQWMLFVPPEGIGAETQWGHVFGSGGSVDTFTGGVTLPFAAGHGDVSLSIGSLRVSCHSSDCGGYFVASSAVEGRAFQSQIGGATFTLGLSGRIGFANPSDASVWSASATAPLSLAIGSSSGVQFVPFLSPGFGWGHVAESGDSESGTRLLLGGGLGAISTKSGVGFTVGAQKVFIDGGKMVFGAGLTWARR